MKRFIVTVAILTVSRLFSAVPDRTAEARRLLNHLPMRFEPSPGGFAARGPDYRVTLTRQGLEFAWDGAGRQGSTLRLHLDGASPAASLEGADPELSHTSYFLGADTRNWRSAVPNFARVRLRNAYRGIDLVLYGSPQSLEFDFDLAPGADSSAIRMQVSGSAGSRIEEGALVLATAAGKVRLSQPVIYQMAGGERRTVTGRFVSPERGRIAFEVGEYNRALPLTIDPVLSFSTYFGSNENEAARGVGVDGAGNIYVAGYTTSTNLPASAKAVQSAYGGGTMSYQTGDAFVAKFTPAGALSAMTYLGGSGDDTASSLAVDSAGNVYVTGYTNSHDFPRSQNPYQSEMRGAGGNTLFTFGDAFITKLNSGLTQIVYSTYLGGGQDEAATAIAIDETGAAYITGITLSNNFPTTSGAVQTIFHGSGGQPTTDFQVPFFVTGDAFVSKLSPDGSQLVLSTYLGGTQDDAATSIAVDSAHNVYVGGFTISPNFPTTGGAMQTTYGGAEGQNEFYNLGDGFIAKLNPTATALLYSTFVGGHGDDAVAALTVDSSGSVYATGATTSANFPVTAGAFQTVNAGPASNPYAERIVGDAFVVKLKPDGSGLVYGTYLGGQGDDSGYAIAVDPAGNAYVGGSTASGNFPLTPDASQKAYAGVTAGTEHHNNDLLGDGFLAILNSTGKQETFGTFLGGSADDAVEGLAIDAGGNIYVTGITMSRNFPVTGGASQIGFGGFDTAGGSGRLYGDAFVTRFAAPVTGTLAASPANIAVAYAPGGATPAPVTLAISSSSPVAFTVATSGESWLTVSPSSAQTPANLKVTLNPAGLAAGAHNSTITISPGAGFAALTVPVTLTVIGSEPYFTVGSVVNAASGLPGPISPGEMLVLYTVNAGPSQIALAQLTSAGTVSTNVAGTQVFFGGAAAPIIYTESDKVSVIVPYEVAGKSSVAVQIAYNGKTSSTVNLPVAPTSPALFTLNEQGTGQAALLNSDSTVNSDGNPAKPGDEIQLFGTGEGVNDHPSLPDGTLANSYPYPLAVANVSATVDNLPAQVAYAGTAPGGVLGFLQVNIIVPAGVTPGDKQVVITFGTASSPANVTVAIKAP